MTDSDASDPADLSGKAFQAAEVAELYVHRPPYAAGALECIAANAASKGRLLDLGSGEGKIARPMARVFDEVVAVDPSAEMIALGQRLENGRAANLSWVCATAEEVAVDGRFNAVTFASSIHWMEPGPLFAKLAPHLADDHLIAVVAGDEPHAPPWEADWQDFLTRWVPEVTGRPLGSEDWLSRRERHLEHLDGVQMQAFLSNPFTQTVEGFMRCQQSRNTFARFRLGDQLAAFEQELAELLRPHADNQGHLSYRVQTQVTLARVRTG